MYDMGLNDKDRYAIESTAPSNRQVAIQQRRSERYRSVILRVRSSMQIGWPMRAGDSRPGVPACRRA